MYLANLSISQLQVLHPKKGSPTCKCPDCLKKPKISSISQTQSKTQLAFPVKKMASMQKVTVKKGIAEAKTKFSENIAKQSNTCHKQLPDEDSNESCEVSTSNSLVFFSVSCNPCNFEYIGFCMRACVRTCARARVCTHSSFFLSFIFLSENKAFQCLLLFQGK